MPKTLKRVLKDSNNANGGELYHMMNMHNGTHRRCKICKVELDRNTLRWE